MSKHKDSQPATAKPGSAAPRDTSTAITRHKSSAEQNYRACGKDGTAEPTEEKRDIVLSHKDAQAASPADVAACGEEDPGSALEFLVTKDEK